VKKKLIEKRITIGLSQQEFDRLDFYCDLTGRSYTDVIRECVRNLALASIYDSSIESSSDNMQ
jgi:hypothetical protein